MKYAICKRATHFNTTAVHFMAVLRDVIFM